MNAAVKISPALQESKQRVITVKLLRARYKTSLNNMMNDLLKIQFEHFRSLSYQHKISNHDLDNFLRCIRQRAPREHVYHDISNLLLVDYADGKLTVNAGAIWRGLVGEYDKTNLNLGCCSLPIDLDQLVEVDDNCEVIRKQLLLPTMDFFYKCWTSLISGDNDFKTFYNKLYELEVLDFEG